MKNKTERSTGKDKLPIFYVCGKDGRASGAKAARGLPPVKSPAAGVGWGGVTSVE